MTRSALGGQQETQRSNVDPSKTTAASYYQPTHLLVVAQGYGNHANLFRVPSHQDIPAERLLDEQIQQFIIPSLLARPFMKYVVGTADIIRVASSRSAVPTLAEKVVLGHFREDHVLQGKDISLETLQSDLDRELLHACEHTTNSLQGHTAVVIRTVLDKARVATCLLMFSALALVVGIALAITFPKAEIGSIISTATIALACLLQACVAWCQR
ncbi:MAG: hypothetical protein LQ346_006422 [Caloplaca aetnensis]|nr:MAG: hypothetical protein LQ346_006422 [Caloplaca aetnensis]